VADPRPARETREILDRLSTQHPGADTELHYHSPFELLIATILSAQCTDKRVNLVTKDLFKRCRSAHDYATISSEELERIIQSTGFFRAKARSIRSCCAMVVIMQLRTWRGTRSSPRGSTRSIHHAFSPPEDDAG